MDEDVIASTMAEDGDVITSTMEADKKYVADLTATCGKLFDLTAKDEDDDWWPADDQQEEGVKNITSTMEADKKYVADLTDLTATCSDLTEVQRRAFAAAPPRGAETSLQPSWKR